MPGTFPLLVDLNSTKPSIRAQRSTPDARTTGPRESTISQVARTSISLEYASLRHGDHCPLGMYVVPSVESLLIWDAVLFVHQGYYSDAILKFNITFPSDYPERQPVVRFVTDVFHPLISQNGVFNLSPRFRPWRPKEHHVFDVLHFIKAAFKRHALDKLQEDDCVNKEAFRLYRNSTSSFAALATQSSLLSQSESALYDKDHPSMADNLTDGITFRSLTTSQLQECRTRLGLREWVEGR